MEIKNDIIYLIEEKKEIGRVTEIKAGKQWVDNKVKRYEGIKLKIPLELKNYNEVTFVVLSIKRKDYENYILHLHSHDFDINDLKEHYEISQSDEYCMIDAGGDIEVTLTIKIDLLSKWTGVPAGEIRRAFDTVNLGSTYNLIVSMPRKIIVTKKEITITFNPHKKVDTSNVCVYILDDKHPIDS